ncbi:MAG: hypothetical protein ACRDRL_28945 [Sciscionella sp.]
MQTLDWPSREAYLARLFGSHDFSVVVDVLDMEERPQGSATFLDGQVNLQSGQAVRRTCTLTLSDPDGALDLSTSSAWSGTSLWADRLVRVRHTIDVGGRDVSATVFEGVPVTLSRSGGEVNVELQDKTALATRGSRPLRLNKGMRAVDAIRQIFEERCGETRFRFPHPSRRLSYNYAVGWEDKSSPWAVASRIASHQLGMDLLYTCDGYLMLRRRPKASCLAIPGVTEQAKDAIDFSTLDNWVQVLGKTSTHRTRSATVKTQPQTIDSVRGSLSPSALGRRGVPRYLPLVVTEESYTKTSQTKARAEREINKHGRLQDQPQVSCIPVFHLDADDLVDVSTPDGSRQVRFSSGSIPLGVGGEMTIGAHRWVSAAPSIRSHSRQIRRTHRRR